MQHEGFWDFSLRTYRCRGVPEACLALQGGAGADVNLVLWCCWAGGRAAPLGDEVFRQALEFSVEWSDRVVKPLRSARRWMKSTGCGGSAVDRDACMALRTGIKSVELRAEQLQQQALAALPLAGTSEEGGPRSIASNLIRYFEAIGAGIGADVRVHLRTIVSAAFPDAGAPSLEEFERALQKG